jgi:hypothetical protein
VRGSGLTLRILRISLFLAVICPVFSVAQQPKVPPAIPAQEQPLGDEEQRSRIEKELAKKASQDRQAQLKRDTARLLKLATELQQYVDRSNENTLSLDVIKKAEEIEKLAHSVKEKMKGN